MQRMSETSIQAATETARAMTESGRLQELDCLRGVAAFLVVISHLSFSYHKLFPQAQAPSVALHIDLFAVLMFFMISGFVILMTLERSKTALDFVVSRFSRLYPAYWACVLITFGVVAWFGLAGHERTFTEMLVNLTMVQGLFHVPHVDWSYWTLQVELFFYANMLLIYMLGGIRRIEFFLLGWLFLRLVYLVAPLVAALNHVALSYTLERILLLEFIPYFGLGICFYRFYRGTGIRPVLYTCVLLALASIAIQGEGFAESLLGLVIFTLFIKGYLRWIIAKPLVFLGVISYPLYLIHQYVGYTLMQQLAMRGWPADLNCLLAILLALMLATLISLGVERPSMRWIRRSYARWKKTSD